MSTFLDSGGREWSVRVTLSRAEFLRREEDVDILAIETLWPQLLSDPLLLGRTLWGLCHSQARERGVSREDFLDAITGETIDRARQALEEALTAFFPPLKAKAAKAIFAEMSRVVARLTDEMIETLPTLGEQCIAAAASSASTQAQVS